MALFLHRFVEAESKWMKQYLAYLLLGYSQIYALLFVWGFTKGPVNNGPYIVLITAACVVLIAAPLATLYEFFSALVCMAAMVVPIGVSLFYAVAHKEGVGGFDFVYTAIPVILVVESGYRIFRVISKKKKLGQRKNFSWQWVAVLAIIPYLLASLWIWSIV
jgi:hypothetical protein